MWLLGKDTFNWFIQTVKIHLTGHNKFELITEAIKIQLCGLSKWKKKDKFDMFIYLVYILVFVADVDKFELVSLTYKDKFKRFI